MEAFTEHIKHYNDIGYLQNMSKVINNRISELIVERRRQIRQKYPDVFMQEEIIIHNKTGERSVSTRSRFFSTREIALLNQPLTTGCGTFSYKYIIRSIPINLLSDMQIDSIDSY